MIPTDRLKEYLDEVTKNWARYDQAQELARCARLLKALLDTVHSIDHNDSYDAMKKLEQFDAVIDREIGPMEE